MIWRMPTLNNLPMNALFSFAIRSLPLAAVLAATAGCAGLSEKTNAVAGTTAEIGNKVDGAIRRGISSGNTAAINATKAAEGPIDRTAKKIGLPRGSSSPASPERGGN